MWFLNNIWITFNSCEYTRSPQTIWQHFELIIFVHWKYFFSTKSYVRIMLGISTSVYLVHTDIACVFMMADNLVAESLHFIHSSWYKISPVISVYFMIVHRSLHHMDRSYCSDRIAHHIVITRSNTIYSCNHISGVITLWQNFKCDVSYFKTRSFSTFRLMQNKRRFAGNYFMWKVLYFDSNSSESCSQGSN